MSNLVPFQPRYTAKRKRDDRDDDALSDDAPYNDKTLGRYCSMFEAAEDASRKARQKAERDVDYYDGKQLTEKEYRELVKRGQQPHVDNKIKPKIRYFEGLEQQQRTDPRALPRTPQHEEDANSVTDCLRYVTEENDFHQTRSRVWKDILNWGWSGYEVVFEQRHNSPNAKVIVRRCQADRMFWDPFSEAEDYSDARYLGLAVWGDRDEFISRYGEDASKVFDETLQTGIAGDTYDDKPKQTTWIAYDKRYRVRIIQMYFRTNNGSWRFCEFTKGGFLSGGPSPWMDDEGQPEHPYAWGSANVDRDNNRYGEVRMMIDPQDAINKRQSKFLHWMSVRQTFGNEMAMGSMSTRELREQAARPDGHFALGADVEWGKHFGVVPTTDMAQGMLQLHQIAIGEMTVQGPNAAMQGKDPRLQSGRAILAQQQGGALEGQPVFDMLRQMDREAYKKIWRRIRQSWQAQDYIRVTDDERNIKWVGVNMPKLVAATDQQGNPVIDPATGRPRMQPMIDPQTGQPVMQNELSKLEVDIIMDEAPHVGTLQQEEFLALIEAAKAGLPIPPKSIIKASSLRSKHDILKDMEQAAQQPNPQQQELQLKAQESQMQIQLKAQEAQQEAQIKMAEAQQSAALAEQTTQQKIAMLQKSAEVEGFLHAQKTQADRDAKDAEMAQKLAMQERQHAADLIQQREKHDQALQLEREKAMHEVSLRHDEAQHDAQITQRQTDASIEAKKALSDAQAEAIRNRPAPKKAKE